MRKFLDKAEFIFTILALLTYTGGPLVVILSGGESEGQQGPEVDLALVRVFFQFIYLLTFLFLAPHWKRALYLLLKEKTILILLGAILFSILWSVNPGQTMNRSIAIIGTSLFGIYLPTRYTLRQILHLLGWAFGLSITLSILFAVGLPRYGIMGGTHTGTWRGIYTHKNTLGAMMALSSVVFLLLAIEAKKRSWLLWLGLSLSILLLLLSKSSSPLINLMILLPAFLIFRTFRWHYSLRTFALSFLSFIGFSSISLAVTNAESLVSLLGKDLTFTGRSAVWIYVWEMIQQRPWLGYGYGSLWKDWYSETSYVWRGAGWEAPNAHNGFLELGLGLGLLGATIFLIQFLTALKRALVLVSKSKTSACFLPLLFMLFTILANLTESTFLDRNSIYWVLYGAMLLSLVSKRHCETETALPQPEPFLGKTGLPQTS